MRKSFRTILKEQEIDELDKPLFGDKGGAKSEESPFGDEENEMEITEPEQTQEDPTFTFEIEGNFDFHELQKFVKENSQGLEAKKDGYKIIVETVGEVTDAQHEEFYKYIEGKINFLKYLE